MSYPRPRVRTRSAALLLALALTAVACGGGSGPSVQVAQVAERASEVPPTDAYLVTAGWPEAAAFIARANEQGKPVVMNIFASWCGPCRAEAPVLRAAIERYPDVQFLGVDHVDNYDKGAAFLEEEQLDFPTLYDREGVIAEAVGSRGMPTTAFFDHEGNLVHSKTGVLTESFLAQRIADLEAAAGQA